MKGKKKLIAKHLKLNSVVVLAMTAIIDPVLEGRGFGANEEDSVSSELRTNPINYPAKVTISGLLEGHLLNWSVSGPVAALRGEWSPHS